MTPEIALVLGIIAVALVLFATERLRVDVIALMVLLTLALTGLVTPEEAFAGFANPAVITVWAVYIVSGGLFRTGVADFLGANILRFAGDNEPRLIAVIMLTCGTMSAFMNNIGATAVLLPAVIGISRQSGVPASKLLMPLAFSSLLGGNMTLIGTPPNVLASTMLSERGHATFSFFDFTPTGIVVFAVGVIYMVVVGRHLVPDRESPDEVAVTRRFREYASEVTVPPDSPLAGMTLHESRLGADYDLTVLAIVRNGRARTDLRSTTRLQPGDLLVIRGGAENLLRARTDLGLALDIELEDHEGLHRLDPEDAHIIEATLAPRSRIEGRTLREVAFRDRYGFTVLAIWRHGELITRRLRNLRLQFGDALLMQGPRKAVPGLVEDEAFLVLEPLAIEHPRGGNALVAVGILGLVLVLTSVVGMAVATAMVIGSVLMVLTRCLTMDEAYESIEWRSVFLIAGMLPLGTAMETTGAGNYLAELVVAAIGAYGPIAVLAGIYVLASLITEPMSNAAATVLMVPIAIDIAMGLGADPRPFVLATVIGASTSFLTPVGHQVNVLVFGPGGYRFSDYVRVGGPLNLVLFLVTMLIVPLIWPLFP